MSRIGSRLAQLRAAGRSALAPFITAGDPNLQTTAPALHALVRGGADLLELGIPFSDPEADGPAIQAASERALAQGATLRDVLALVAEFRTRDAATPIILMGYLNSILALGEAQFARQAAEAGVDGCILVNLPPEEAGELGGALAARGIDLIFLAAPTTTDERLRLIDRAASGFLYCVSLKGITGADHIAPQSVARNLARIRRASRLPVLVGFGIKDGATARALAEHADGVVVGSALVSRMGELAERPEAIPEALASALGEIRRALDHP